MTAKKPAITLPRSATEMSSPGFFWRMKWLAVLLTLFLLDFSPIPFSAAVLLYLYLFRPLWFKRFIEKLYSE